MVVGLIGILLSQMKPDTGDTNKVEKLGVKLPSPEILSFSTSAEIIKQGESATIKWDTTNADQVRIEPLGEVKSLRI